MYPHQQQQQQQHHHQQQQYSHRVILVAGESNAWDLPPSYDMAAATAATAVGTASGGQQQQHQQIPRNYSGHPEDSRYSNGQSEQKTDDVRF